MGNLGECVSVKVPNVQELVAKENLSTLLPRYIRHHHHHHHHDLIPSNGSSLPQIPVIDMEKLFQSNVIISELDKLHNASKEWGFFRMINHGVKLSTMETMKSEMQEFFNLPIEEKNKLGQEAGDIEGYGQHFVLSEEEKLDWADMMYLVTSPNSLRKPHLIPNLPPTFRDAIEAYSSEVKDLTFKTLDIMVKALGMKHEDMKTLFGAGMQAMRMNYYPPCPQPELVTGLCPHSDAGALTILLQVNEIEGLQIKKDGVWIPVSPLPNAFVVNIGDTLEIVTNGTYHSVEHQALVNAEKERLSIATIMRANLDGELGPAPSLITPENPAKFKTIGVDDYYKGYFTTELNGKSRVDALRIN